MELATAHKDAAGPFVSTRVVAKFSAMTLLRAMDAQYSTTPAVLRLFYETKTVGCGRPEAVENCGLPSMTSMYPPSTLDAERNHRRFGGHNHPNEAA